MHGESDTVKEIISLIMQKGIEHPQYIEFCSLLTTEIVTKFSDPKSNSARSSVDFDVTEILNATIPAQPESPFGASNISYNCRRRHRDVDQLIDAVGNISLISQSTTTTFKPIGDCQSSRCSTSQSSIPNEFVHVNSGMYIAEILGTITYQNFQSVQGSFLEFYAYDVDVEAINHVSKAAQQNPGKGRLLVKLWRTLIDQDTTSNDCVSKFRVALVDHIMGIPMYLENLDDGNRVMLEGAVVLAGFAYLEDVIHLEIMEDVLSTLCNDENMNSWFNAERILKLCEKKLPLEVTLRFNQQLEKNMSTNQVVSQNTSIREKTVLTPSSTGILDLSGLGFNGKVRTYPPNEYDIACTNSFHS